MTTGKNNWKENAAAELRTVRGEQIEHEKSEAVEIYGGEQLSLFNDNPFAVFTREKKSEDEKWKQN